MVGTGTGRWRATRDVRGAGAVSVMALSAPGVVAATTSRGCGGGDQVEWARSLAKSTIFSVALQKYGGLSVQPMGRTKGKATKGGSPGATGKATPSMGMSESRIGTRLSHQKGQVSIGRPGRQPGQR